MNDYPCFAVTVDLVVLTIRDDGAPGGRAPEWARSADNRLSVLLIRRGVAPHKGRWALPGGFVKPDEDLAIAAARELHEETGLTAADAHLEQLASYGEPRRDPRGRVVTVAYLALLPDLPPPTAGSDAAGAQWRAVDEMERQRLAFDHDRILADGVERARAKLEYTSLAAAFCAPEFTVAELRAVYETVWGVPIDPRNFHRKVTGTPGFVEPTGQSTVGGQGRPAALYRRGNAKMLHPPLLRPGSAGLD